VLAYYTTRWVASARFGRLGKRNLEIVESIGVGTQAYVHLVRVGKKYALVGVTRTQVSPLYELNEDDILLDEVSSNANFETIFSRFQRKSEAETGENTNSMNEGDGSDKEQ
jgi:flagellar protein FliO/FliZ